jgi:hypothetical protein
VQCVQEQKCFMKTGNSKSIMMFKVFRLLLSLIILLYHVGVMGQMRHNTVHAQPSFLFDLFHDTSLSYEDSCHATGQFTIIVNSTLKCVNPQFTIRLWNDNQISKLKHNSLLQVPYEIFHTPDEDVNLTTTIEIVMIYCQFNSSSIKDNNLQRYLLESPVYLMLNTSQKESSLSTMTTPPDQCLSPPSHWKLNRSHVNASLETLKGIRIEAHGNKKRMDHMRHLEYTNLKTCGVPTNKETICIVGASHARVLQVMLHRQWKDSSCSADTYKNMYVLWWMLLKYM